MKGINAFPNPKAWSSDQYFGASGFFPNGAGAVDNTKNYGAMKGLFTVIRDAAAGFFKVTMDPGIKAPINPRITVQPICKAGSEFLAVRSGKWDNANHCFHIQVVDFAGAAADVAADPDAAIEFYFELTNHDRPR